MEERIINLFLELEEQQYLLKKRIFELLKLAAEAESKLDQIADVIYNDVE